ncbi:MAG: response regulator [Saprospiraceae bacterium]|nr:response regulator [Saprospiraceae bacterium]
MASPFQILYVDDEEDNLIAFKAVFRRHFQVHLAQSGQDALALLDQQNIDLIISDQRMPKMTGVELLEQVRERFPDIIRMVLTGYSDVQAIIDAINKGKIYHYITKPWDVDELKIIMENALETYLLKKRNKELEEEKTSLQLQNERMEKENILSQFSILKNQINPHFLFNSMNILAALIPSAPDKAVAFTTRFAKLYRKVLELRDQLIIPLSQELEFVDSFLFLQKMRFDESLIINYNIEPRHRESCLPPFALQLLVENAIKHNIVSEDQPLTINIFTEGDILQVINNLQLRGSVEDSTGIGLANLRARYEMIAKQKIFSGEEGAQYVTRLPLLVEED